MLKIKDRHLPIIAISMGDPAGIGPEIAIKALTSGLLQKNCIGLIIGDLSVLQQTASYMGRNVVFNTVKQPAESTVESINVLDLKLISPKDFSIGNVQQCCGRAAYEYINCALELTMQGKTDALVTNPISKEAFKKAGIDFVGHTELLAQKTGAENYSMVFYLDGVCVAHVTTHCSLLEAISKITVLQVLKTIRLLHQTLRRLGKVSPRIACAGLNPHAGENGLFGTEEQKHIAPAIKAAQDEGIDVLGPYPPDSVFMRAFNGEFDGVVSMLHDHGFTALKSRNFEEGVNITIGLPIVRTSPGHGTAFDKAGRGIASEKGLISAIKMALLLLESQKS